jgi:predicted RNA methylase
MEMKPENMLEEAVKIIAEGHIVLCPSLGEYPVYDELLYDMMCEDAERMNAYRNAIKKHAKDKAIVEIGTGSRAPLALMCAEGGARIVYPMEGNPEAAEEAARLIRSKHLEGKVKIISGYSNEVTLPEKADLCVSEIIGNIGSSEGAISIINSAKHFLKEDGHILPERCVTKIAPAFLPENIYKNDMIETVLDEYLRQVYKVMGCKFPITRHAVYNFPESNIITEPGIFEDIYFNREMKTEESRKLEFKIEKDCRFDGFLLWVNLYVDEDNVIDTFKSASWAPVFLKIDGETGLFKGDVMKVECLRKLSRNNINPDYFIRGQILRENQTIKTFKIDSYYTTP